MCGINLSFGKQRVECMNAAIGHRGIRSKIQYLHNGMYLGHVRLPIQGLDPQFDHPAKFGEWTGAFVGEIFNYKEFDPMAASDLPVLMNGWAHKGTDIFEEFDGFWSAIFYDGSHRVHVVTDFLSKKPLYIRTDGRQNFGISSEIKGLWNLGPVTPDEIYFSAVAKWGYCQEEIRTPFNEIKKLPAGVHLIYDTNGQQVSVGKYAEFRPNRHASLYKELKIAVKNRLVSDVPVSLLMSGGLDSTIIYYLMKELTDEPINIFHIENDEAEFLEYIDFRPQDNIEALDIPKDYDLDTILMYNDGPVDLGSMVPQFLMSEALRKKGFNVCLSGDGADELFGGYKRAMEYDSQYSDIFHELISYHLPRLDKMMMANTVELRCPFLAKPVIEIAMGLPWEDRRQKDFLKYTFSGIIPEPIIERKKKPLRYKNNRRHELINTFRNLIWRD